MDNSLLDRFVARLVIALIIGGTLSIVAAVSSEDKTVDQASKSNAATHSAIIVKPPVIK